MGATWVQSEPSLLNDCPVVSKAKLSQILGPWTFIAYPPSNPPVPGGVTRRHKWYLCTGADRGRKTIAINVDCGADRIKSQGALKKSLSFPDLWRPKPIPGLGVGSYYWNDDHSANVHFFTRGMFYSSTGSVGPGVFDTKPLARSYMLAVARSALRFRCP
jgi:hypothetical protein